MKWKEQGQAKYYDVLQKKKKLYFQVIKPATTSHVSLAGIGICQRTREYEGVHLFVYCPNNSLK
jgi:hypothetical protein